MSDAIKHECGIALIRLRKPLEYYIEKYGNPAYAYNKLYLLMQKQRNRGQDGAGIANIKVGLKPGMRYISRTRSTGPEPVDEIFAKVRKRFKKAQKEGLDKYFDANWLKENHAYTGELWLGHLRYATHGKHDIESCHPILRQNNWRSRNLVMAGNFNLTNVDELFEKLIDLGQHPKEKIDTVTVMEKVGHFLDEEVKVQFEQHKQTFSNREITDVIEDSVRVGRVLKRAFKDFDGGYTMAGLFGYGASFVVRDPMGIRPAYYYADDEVVVAASEKPAIKTAFDVDYDEIKEIEPGNAIIVNKNGDFRTKEIIPAGEKKSCSFERIYFSRGTDPDIYSERKNLGKFLVPHVLEEIEYDLKNTIFSYIPNTAETSFLGMTEELDKYLVKHRIKSLKNKDLSEEELEKILTQRPRVEKLVLKDAKLRTFIADDEHRDEIVSNVYDSTYEVVEKEKDTLVIIDDSIVRGTTLEKSILKMLDRLHPKKIIILSSAPQIRFPDCYGIDMSRMREFIAFRAVLALLKESGLDNLLDEVYDECIANEHRVDQENYVKKLYEPFTYEQVSDKISEIVTPPNMKAEVKVIFQTIDNLQKACPDHKGDWYFTGNYPTSGGNRVVNRSFTNFMEGKTVRAY
ncbi:MAG: amidophosphoribosyltransferase [Bacteroidota bacterium]